MSDDSGFRYLWSTVVTGDVQRAASTALTRYYAASGTPAGRWVGAGLTGLTGELRPGSVVDEAAMWRLFGMGQDPTTGEPLGRRPQRNAVIGFDWTFSVPKSVSALWAIADANLQETIVVAHRAAIGDALSFAEAEIAATRTGHGGVAQVPVSGLIAAAFDHWDSRANDPHLHTHVAVANRVQGLDGRWRTLDGSALFRATVALSELHQGLLMDRLTTVVGVGWDARLRPRSDVPQWEIEGVPDGLRAEFSRRSQAINRTTDVLLAGRRVGQRALQRVRQQATLETRADKHTQTLAELTAQWRERAGTVLNVNPTEWSRRLLGRSLSPPADPDIDALSDSVLAVVSERRAVFGRWNLHAEASRQLHGHRFATPADRLRMTNRVADAAIARAVELSAPALTHTPAGFTRPDGTSVFRHQYRETFTTTAVLAAEDRLITASRRVDGPRSASLSTRTLSIEQATAVAAITTSGRVVDVLVGPAGAGKTTTLAGVLDAWTATHGPGSVIGLAPSAVAADVLAQDLGIVCDNTAKFLHDRPAIKAAQLVVIDEASLAGTLAIDNIASIVAAAGAKLLLAGDWAQLSAVEAGGAFALLARDRPDPPALLDIHRFTNTWERAASLDLRAQREIAIDTYIDHDRVHGAPAEATIDAAYNAWMADRAAGLSSLLIAIDADTVTELNRRARADLIVAGLVANSGVTLADGTLAGIGDEVITRLNDRRLAVGRGWVKNGDRFVVIAVHSGGALRVRRPSGGTITLPAAYVADHVELGYAVTAHRAQGRTVDVGHAVISPTAACEGLYVALTRGRSANHAWVVTDYVIDAQTSHGPPPLTSASDVLRRVLTRSGADLSAHETLRTELDLASGWPQLAAEYTTLAAEALRQRYAHLTAALPVDSSNLGPLLSALDLAARAGLTIGSVQPVANDEAAAALAGSLQHWASTRPLMSGTFVAGLLPRITGAEADLQRGLDERAALLERRAQSMLEGDPSWLRRLPLNARRSATAATVAAYRDRWGVSGDHPLGRPPRGDRTQLADYLQAHEALDVLTREGAESSYRDTSLTLHREEGINR